MYKPLLQSARDPKPSMVENWENATTSLASAISHFCELSTILESQCMPGDPTSKDLAARIDWGLSLFQTTLDGQLIQARLALAKTRNRLIRASSILRLPGEILADIFLRFVFYEDQFPTMKPMNLSVQLIYQRIHTVLQVCTTWRNTAIACGSLWTIIPIVDPSAGYRARILSTDLSLQRAGNRDLHLTIFRPHSIYPRLDALIPYLSQLASVNIWSRSSSTFEIRDMISLLIRDPSLKSLSKLSLKSETLLPSNIHHNPFTLLDARLIALIESLSVLRISHITVSWGAVSFNFSHTLTEFWLGDIVLDNEASLGFFSTLSSASELQKLTIVSVRALLDDITVLIPSTTPFPKLKSLYLESLPFNLLGLLLEFIGPGSYCFTLNPRDEIHFNYPAEENVAEEDVCAMLRKMPVHTLRLAAGGEGFWETEVGLRSILESVPSMKTLTLNFYDIKTSIMKAFVPRFARSPDYTFPNLEVLEIYAADFRYGLDDPQADFSNLLDHHPIRKMVLGGMVKHKSSIYGTSIDAESDIFRWLKPRIPQVNVYENPGEAPAHVEEWELWDM